MSSVLDKFSKICSVGMESEKVVFQWKEFKIPEVFVRNATINLDIDQIVSISNGNFWILDNITCYHDIKR